jgi:glycosyltransferase involved in cell wall biosynthesis
METGQQPMRIMIVTDAWHPQTNGVVRTLEMLVAHLAAHGHAVDMVTPADFSTFPCPTYPEIRLALCTARTFSRRIARFSPDSLHIATEGPLGFAARRLCLRNDYRFTTAFHTKFPDYLYARARVPLNWSYAALRRFHAPSAGIMVAAASIRSELAERGFGNLKPWSRGVDASLFRPYGKDGLPYPRPIFVALGRLAVEKNLDAFLSLDLPGTKLVIGDGPAAAGLRAHYSDAVFVGHQTGEQLARMLGAADVLVFPSLTDTFGLVLLEALACGVPVAAYPVSGPLDIVVDAAIGCLDWDLGRAARGALGLPPEACRAHALEFTWEKTCALFLSHLVPMRGVKRFGHATFRPLTLP